MVIHLNVSKIKRYKMMCGKNLSSNPCPVCPFTGHHSGLITSVLFQGLRNAYTSKYRFILFPLSLCPKGSISIYGALRLASLPFTLYIEGLPLYVHREHPHSVFPLQGHTMVSVISTPFIATQVIFNLWLRSDF